MELVEVIVVVAGQTGSPSPSVKRPRPRWIPPRCHSDTSSDSNSVSTSARRRRKDASASRASLRRSASPRPTGRDRADGESGPRSAMARDHRAWPRGRGCAARRARRPCESAPGTAPRRPADDRGSPSPTNSSRRDRLPSSASSRSAIGLSSSPGVRRRRLRRSATGSTRYSSKVDIAPSASNKSAVCSVPVFIPWQPSRPRH